MPALVLDNVANDLVSFVERFALPRGRCSKVMCYSSRNPCNFHSGQKGKDGVTGRVSPVVNGDTEKHC